MKSRIHIFHSLALHKAQCRHISQGFLSKSVLGQVHWKQGLDITKQDKPKALNTKSSIVSKVCCFSKQLLLNCTLYRPIYTVYIVKIHIQINNQHAVFLLNTFCQRNYRGLQACSYWYVSDTPSIFRSCIFTYCLTFWVVKYLYWLGQHTFLFLNEIKPMARIRKFVFIFVIV